MFRSVLDTALFSDIDIIDKTFVLSKFVERTIPKYQVLFRQGDPGLNMFIIKSGALKIYRQDDDKEIVLGHQFAGGSIGELEVLHHDHHRLASVAAMEQSTLWMIQKHAVEELIDVYPQLLRKFFYVVSERLNQANRKIEYLAFLDVRVRGPNLLLDLYSNFGACTEEGYLIDWRITQQHLANMIGIGRESIARTLLEFQDEGWILISNRKIVIVDLSALQTRAGQKQEITDSRKWHSWYKYEKTSY